MKPNVSSWTFFVRIALMLAVASVPWIAHAQILGTDYGGNYTFGDAGTTNWTSGSNHGSGYGTWTFTTTNAGSAKMLTDGGGFTGGFNGNDNILVAGTAQASGGAWWIRTNDGSNLQTATAFRTFSNTSGTSLVSGQSLHMTMESPYFYLGSLPIGQYGMSLRNGNATGSASDFGTGVRSEFFYAGNNNTDVGGNNGGNYSLTDAAGTVTAQGYASNTNAIAGIPFGSVVSGAYTGSSSGVRLNYVMTGANTYNLYVRDLGTNIVYSIVGRTFATAGTGSIDSIALFQQNRTSSTNAYYNSLETIGSGGFTWNGGAGNANISSASNWVGGLAPIDGDTLHFAGTTGLSGTNSQSPTNVGYSDQRILAVASARNQDDSIQIGGLHGINTIQLMPPPEGPPADGIDPNFDQIKAVQAIVFDSGAGAFVLSGNALQIAGGITNSSGSAQTIGNNLFLLLSQTFDAGTASGGSMSFSGIISGATGANLTKAGTNTITLSGASTYTGTTTINAGTLRIDNNNTTSARLAGTSAIAVNSGGTLLLAQSGGTASLDRINNSATMTLSGGTFNTGGLSEHGASNHDAGIGALTLSSTSIIDLGSGASIIAFADSHSIAWTGTLNIYNWSGTLTTGNGTDQLYIGSTSGGLTSSQLAEIQFFSGAGTGSFGLGALILSTGEVVPIPEPGTWITAAFALGAIGYTQRRRLSRFCRLQRKIRAA